MADESLRNKGEETLAESESLYKELFYNGPFPKGIVDGKTLKCLEVNEMAIALYGYTREEFLQLTVYDIRMPEEHLKLRKQLEKGSYAADKSIRAHRKKNGDLIMVEPFITEISYKGGPAFLVTINDLTEKLRLQDQLIRTKMNRKNEISRASMEAQEKYWASIGRELHDNVNQLLAVAHLCLKNLQPASEVDRKLLEKGTTATTAAIAEIRKLSWSLVPPSLADLSLKDSIENIADDLKLTGAVVEFNATIHENVLSDGLKVNIYRIVQELFSNITKYSEASKVMIHMNHEENLLTLDVSDNGKGFDQTHKSKGIGLQNIIHRAEAYNGEVTIQTSPGQGCRVVVEFKNQ